MKLLLPILLFTATFSFAQEVPVVEIPPKAIETIPVETDKHIEVCEFPDKEAEFVGGLTQMATFIKDEINYPQISIEMKEQGTVYLTFLVEDNGEVSNVTVVRGVSAPLDREAKRVVRSMPKWIPGECDGRPATTKLMLPIKYLLPPELEEPVPPIKH